MLTNHDDYDARTSKAVGLFEVDDCENNHVYIRKTNDGYRYHRLYKNENEPFTDDVQAYVDEIRIDLIYIDRIHRTLFCNETYRNYLLSDAREYNGDKTFWDIFSIDIDNDGQDEFFDRKILYNGGSDMEETTVTWYNPEIHQVCPAPFDIWKPAHYFLTQQWFKSINNRTVVFSLYHNVSEEVYLLDDRILENGRTTVLLDYVIDLFATVELAEYWDYTDTNWEGLA